MKFEEAIAEIKKRTDISQVIGRYVKLRRRGKNLQGLCPFHREKTPSFYVQPDKGYFKCFGCSASGDVFSFLEKQTGQLFIDIVKQLAEELGITLEDSSRSFAKNENASELNHLKSIVQVAQQFFHQQLRLPADPFGAVKYLTVDRRLSMDTIQHFDLGFGGSHTKAFVEFLQEHKIPLEKAYDIGFLRHKDQEVGHFFEQRITVPIRNIRGQVVAFGARLLKDVPDSPKYLNSKSTDLYDKSSTLFGLFESLQALKNGQPVVLVEGYFDVMMLHQLHIPAVAPCGTSLTDEHIRILQKYTKQIVLSFDNDAAGLAAHRKALLKMLAFGLSVKTVSFEAKDPDEACRKNPSHVKQAFSAPQDALEKMILQVAQKRFGNLAERIAAIDGLIPFLAASPRALVRQQYIRYAALALVEDEKTLQQEVDRLVRRTIDMPVAKVKKEAAKWTQTESILLRAVVAHPSVVNKCNDDTLEHVNATLKDFLTQLKSVLNTGVDAASALRHVSVVPDKNFINLLLDAQKTAGLISADEALSVVEGFILKIAQIRQKQLLKDGHASLVEAEKRGDLGTVRETLLLQSNRLKSKVTPKVAQQAVRSFQAPVAEDKNDEDWPDDGGWT